MASGARVEKGFASMSGDAAVVMMADESDDCRDVVRYWELLNQGWDAVFGSRFLKGGGVIDYPWLKLRLNRLRKRLHHAHVRDQTQRYDQCLQSLSRHGNQGCLPLLSPHFNLTVELPLKTIVRGYSWTVMPITWRNRRVGTSKLSIKEMGSRYLFICLYIWLEKYFSRGDYKKSS